MPAKTLIAAAAVVVCASCTRTNSRYCEQLSDCEIGYVCDTVARECQFDGQDAGYDGSGCADSTDCTGALPICSADHACVACAGVGTGDADCAARDPSRPLCRADGSCGECVTDADCTDLTADFCDQSTGSCRGCIDHSECASEVCNRDIGTCADSSGILYVDAAGSDGDGCGGQSSPCASITGGGGALVKVEPTRRTIRVRAAASAYPEALALDGIAVVIVGGGASLTPVVIDQPVIDVTGGANVTIEGLTLAGAAGDGRADGVHCAGTDSIVRLIDVTVENNADLGVDIEAPCDLRVARSVIRGSDGGGLRTTGDRFDIVSSMLVDNGSGSAVVGGALLGGSAGGMRRFELNTVAGNTVTGGNAGGVQCGGAVAGSGTILWGNSGGSASGGACSWIYSDVQGGASGDGNLDADPLFADPGQGDYHLTASSPCVDAADPLTTVVLDVDGDARPQGASADIGADEVTP